MNLIRSKSQVREPKNEEFLVLGLDITCKAFWRKNQVKNWTKKGQTFWNKIQNENQKERKKNWAKNDLTSP